jgi:hypothetical protein
MPTFSAATAMQLLWDKAARELHPHEMEWFASGASRQIQEDARQLKEVTEGLAALVASDTDVGSFTDKDGVSTLLFHVSSQLSTMQGLAEIAHEAQYRARVAAKG